MKIETISLLVDMAAKLDAALDEPITVAVTDPDMPASLLTALSDANSACMRLVQAIAAYIEED